MYKSLLGKDCPEVCLGIVPLWLVAPAIITRIPPEAVTVWRCLFCLSQWTDQNPPLQSCSVNRGRQWLKAIPSFSWSSAEAYCNPFFLAGGSGEHWFQSHTKDIFVLEHPSRNRALHHSTKWNSSVLWTLGRICCIFLIVLSSSQIKPCLCMVGPAVHSP